MTAAGKPVPRSEYGMRPFSLGNRAGADTVRGGWSWSSLHGRGDAVSQQGGNECWKSLSGEQFDLELPETFRMRPVFF